MIAKPQPWSPASALAAERDGSAKALPSEERGRGFSLTSHSFTLNTKLFNLDVSWKRLEVDAKNQPKRVASPACGTPVQVQQRSSKSATPSFSEVLKRQQLASLLMETTSPSDDSLETIQTGASLLNQAFSGSAHRAYLSVSNHGPLGGDRIYKA
jgi:hypothetical protein